jgi:hypothetical protein
MNSGTKKMVAGASMMIVGFGLIVLVEFAKRSTS